MLENMISELLGLSLLGLASVLVNVHGHGQPCIQIAVNATDDYQFTHAYKDEDSVCLDVTPPNISFGFLIYKFGGIFFDDDQEIITYETVTGKETDGISSDCLIVQFNKACKFAPMMTSTKCLQNVSVKRSGLSKIYVTRTKTRESGNLQDVNVTIRAINFFDGYFNNCSAVTSPADVMILTRETSNPTSSPQTILDTTAIAYATATSCKTTPTQTKSDITTCNYEKTTSTGTSAIDMVGYILGGSAIFIVVLLVLYKCRNRMVSCFKSTRSDDGYSPGNQTDEDRNQ